MVYKQRTHKKKVAKRKTYRKRFRAIPFVSKRMFKRTYFLENVMSGPSDISKAWIFRLSDLPQSTEITNLFDEYRFAKVKIRLEPTFDSNELNDIGAMSLKYARTAIDLNDSSPYGSENDIFQHADMFSHRADRLITRTLKYPAIGAMAYNGIASTGYFAKRGQWVSSANPSLPHYGIRAWLPYLGVPENRLLYRVIIEAWIEGRGIH